MISRRSLPRTSRRDILRLQYTHPSRELQYFFVLEHGLTESSTNVPAIAMSFSDLPFAYGPFVPHYVPKLYIENYFAHHKTDALLSLNTTVEDVSLIKTPHSSKEKWKLTLRKHDSIRQVDVWWEEYFDGVIFANGHYAVPFVSHHSSSVQVCNLTNRQ
jgi:hypothetical protein